MAVVEVLEPGESRLRLAAGLRVDAGRARAPSQGRQRADLARPVPGESGGLTSCDPYPEKAEG
ncbi:hypothetical protein GCM10022224_078800 [Nonomuraea antimicrobica]|uniref:Uncharacterized protein n=1 Tax=Nonomuraea antimicrobica TaxID=561173 RepID=A0ABP7D5Z1_9ACTN